MCNRGFPAQHDAERIVVLGDWIGEGRSVSRFVGNYACDFCDVHASVGDEKWTETGKGMLQRRWLASWIASGCHSMCRCLDVARHPAATPQGNAKLNVSAWILWGGSTQSIDKRNGTLGERQR